MIELKYEELLEESKANNVYVIENADFKSSADGLINGNVIGINRKLQSFCKRTCTLAEELGHYHMTVGNIICLQCQIANRNCVQEPGHIIG